MFNIDCLATRTVSQCTFKRWRVLSTSLVSTRQSTQPPPGATSLPTSSQARARLIDHRSLTQESKPVFLFVMAMCMDWRSLLAGRQLGISLKPACPLAKKIKPCTWFCPLIHQKDHDFTGKHLSRTHNDRWQHWGSNTGGWLALHEQATFFVFFCFLPCSTRLCKWDGRRLFSLRKTERRKYAKKKEMRVVWREKWERIWVTIRDESERE